MPEFVEDRDLVRGHWNVDKTREFQKKKHIYFLLRLRQSLLTVGSTNRGKVSEMGIPQTLLAF